VGENRLFCSKQVLLLKEGTCMNRGTCIEQGTFIESCYLGLTQALVLKAGALVKVGKFAETRYSF
jgi:hypothetical protein